MAQHDRPLAFAAYQAALEREERAAEAFDASARVISATEAIAA